MQNDRETARNLLRLGKTPGNSEVLSEISVGIDALSDFWTEKYLKEYIAESGSKIKFVTGGIGSGKTHFLDLMHLNAQNCGYATVSFSAKDVWIHDFKEIYVAILERVDLLACLSRAADKIMIEMGFTLSEIPPNMKFSDYLSASDLMDGITRRELRLQLAKPFLQNPLIDNNFALACTLITGGILGHPILEEHNKEELLLWLKGDKSASLPALRRLGLSPTRITKFNARHMLRSLVEVLKFAGYTGLLVTIDDVELLLSRDSLEPIRYTKLKREDAYESIRELIDEIDTMKHIMFLFSFDRSLIDEEQRGLKSYQALWMRIQNEISGDRFNRFTDIVDLDAFARQEYNADILVEMSEKLARVLQASDPTVHPIDRDSAEKLIEKSQFSGTALPAAVNIATVGRNVSYD